MLHRAGKTRFLEKISSVCYCTWVLFMQVLKGTKGFLALLNGCYFLPVNNMSEGKKKLLSSEENIFLVLVLRMLIFCTVSNSIDQSEYICVYFTTS